MARVAPLHFGRVEDVLTFRGHEYEAFRKKHELRGWASSEKTKKWVNYAYHLSLPLLKCIYRCAKIRTMPCVRRLRKEMDTYGVYPSSAVIKAISLVRVMKAGLLQLEIHSRVLGSGHLQVVGKGEILVLPGVPNTQP